MERKEVEQRQGIRDEVGVDNFPWLSLFGREVNINRKGKSSKFNTLVHNYVPVYTVQCALLNSFAHLQ